MALNLTRSVKVTFVLMLFCFGSTAQKKDSLNKQLDDVVVTAQYEPRSSEKATYKIKVIDEQKLKALAAVNLKDALSNELNIRFSQDPVLGTGISLQGISGQNVKILIDGVAIVGRQNGNIDLSQINLNNIERIEIVEGPLSVNYGTDALAGVINIITKSSQRKSIGVGLFGYYETNNNYNSGFHFHVKRKAHCININFNRNYFNGWNLNDPYYLIPKKTYADTNRFKNWKPKEQYFGDIKYSIDKQNFKLNFRSAYFNEMIINRGFPLRPYYETAFDDRYKTQRIDNSVNTNIKFKSYKSFNTTLAYNYFVRHKSSYFKDLLDLSEYLSSDASLHDTAAFDQCMARGSFISSKPFQTFNDSIYKYNYFNYEIGYDINYSTAFGKRIEGRTKAISDYAVFATSEIQPIRDLVIRPGIRYSYNTVYSAPLIPSLNLKYNKGSLTYRFSYAKGFRAPDLKELYFEFVDINHNIYGNTNLKAESSDNYNANIKFVKRINKADMNLDVSGFYNDINNLITLALIDGTRYSYVNIGKFRSHGSSGNITVSKNSITCSLGASIIGRYNALSSDHSNVSEYSYTPEGRASIQYGFKKINTNFNCFYKYTGRLPGYNLMNDGNIVQSYIEGFHMLDANLSTHFFKKTLNVSLGAKNAFNVNNVRASVAGGVHSGSSTSTPIAMGRTYFIKLEYNFEK